MGGSLVLGGSRFARMRSTRIIAIATVTVLVAAMLIARAGLPSGATSDATPYSVPQVVESTRTPTSSRRRSSPTSSR